MPAFVEVMVKGDCKAYLEAGSIMGVITSPGCSGDMPGTAEAPLTLVLRGGESLEGIYGISPNRLLLHAAGVSALVRSTGALLKVAYIDRHADLEAEIGEYIGRGDG